MKRLLLSVSLCLTGAFAAPSAQTPPLSPRNASYTIHAMLDPTTHTITGSILGLGATRGMSSVKWGLGEKIVLAWVFTLPSTIAMGGVLYWVLSRMIGL